MGEPRSVVSLTKLEKRFLSRFGCGLCEQSLHRDSCSAIYDRGNCTVAIRDQRRGDALATYKPRAKALSNPIGEE